MYTQFAEEWLAEQGTLTDVQREFLEKALRFYEEFSNEAQSDLDLQLETLRAIERVAAIQSQLGKNSEAESSFNRLIDEGSNLAKEYPEHPEFFLVLSSARTRLSRLCFPLGKIQESERQAELAYGDLQRVKASDLPGDEDRRWLASTLNSLCGQLTQAGNVSEAEKSIERCISIWKSLLREDPGSWKNRMGLARAYSGLGAQRMWWGGKNQEAEAAHSEAESRLAQLLRERPRDRNCRKSRVGSLWNLGVICGWEDRIDEAIALYRQAISILESLVRDFPDDRELRSSLPSLLGNLAGRLQEADLVKNRDEAEEVCRRRLTIARDLADRYPDVKEYHLDIVRASTQLVALLGTNDPAQARAISDQVLEQVAQFAAGADANEYEETKGIVAHIAFDLHMRAALLVELGDHSAAAESLALIPEQERIFRPDHYHALDTTESLHGIKQAQLKARSQCEEQIKSLGWPSVLLLECARLAGCDDSMTLEERESCAEGYRARADAFAAQADLAIKAWRQLLAESVDFKRSPSGYVFHLCEKRCQAVIEEAENECLPAHERSYLTDHQLLMCRQVIRVGVEQHPLDPQMHWVVGYLATGPEELRDPELALEVARRGVEHDPDDNVAKQNLGWALFRAGQWDECIEILVPPSDKLLRDKVDAGASPVVAMALWQLGRRPEAATWFTPSCEDDLRGYQERDAKRRQAGKIAYPTPAMLCRLAQEATELLGIDRERLIEQYYAQTPFDDAHFLAERGLRYCAQGQHEKAIEDLTRAVQLRPDVQDDVLWQSLGEAHHRLHQMEEAVAALSRAFQIKPTSHHSLNMRAYAYADLGKFDEALADRSQIIELRPGANRPYFYRARLYRDMGKLELALADVDKGFLVDPETDDKWLSIADAHTLRGDILRDLAQYDRAVEAYTRAINRDPDNPIFHEKRCKAYEALEMTDHAEADFDEAARLADAISKDSP